jgi:UDP-glucuronate decarboxylase
LRNKTILIAGSTGFLGKSVVDVLLTLDRKYELYLNIIGITPEFEVFGINADICDKRRLKKVLKKYDTIDYILNFAGIANPSQYKKRPVETMDVSYIGTKNILDIARKHYTERVICCSSSEVYGMPDSNAIPTPESYIGRIDTMNERSCYDVGKLILETLCYTYKEKYNVPVTVIRPFNFYGKFLKDDRIIAKMIRSYKDNLSFSIYGKGNQSRSYCHVSDAIVMILTLLLSDNKHFVYNIGNPNTELTVNQLVDIFSEITDGKFKYQYADYPNSYPKNEPMRRCPDISCIVSEFGFEPKIDVETGIKWILNN